jgi:hypothetical protein
MDLGSGIRDPGSGKNLFRIPDPGVKKTSDPGSATLITHLAKIKNLNFFLPSKLQFSFHGTTRTYRMMQNDNCVSWVTTTSPEGHLDLDEGLIAVGQQVLGLPRVDPHHAQQQVTARTQRHLHLQKLLN